MTALALIGLGLSGGAAAGAYLCWTDWRSGLLPKPGLLCLGAAAMMFHYGEGWRMVSPDEAVLGMMFGGSSLWLVRFFSLRFRGVDGMGMGDVRLASMMGLWIGAGGIGWAIAAGYAATLLLVALARLWSRYHRRARSVPLRGFYVPAGPGLLLGLLVVFARIARIS